MAPEIAIQDNAPPPSQAPQGGGGGFDDFNDEIPFARFPNIAWG